MSKNMNLHDNNKDEDEKKKEKNPFPLFNRKEKGRKGLFLVSNLLCPRCPLLMLHLQWSVCYAQSLFIS